MNVNQQKKISNVSGVSQHSLGVGLPRHSHSKDVDIVPSEYTRPPTTTSEAGRTNRYPKTTASVRGSDAQNDIADLTDFDFELISKLEEPSDRVSTFNFGDPPKVTSSMQITGGPSPGGPRSPRDSDEENEDEPSDSEEGGIIDPKSRPQDVQSRVNDWMLTGLVFNRKGSIKPGDIPKRHFLRIINTLDYDEKLLEVGDYMTVNDVLKFYSHYNSNAMNYTWKNIYGEKLKMNKTLKENGFKDHSEVTDETGLDHFPTMLLHFNDGFENDPPLQLDISKPPPTDLELRCRNY